MTEQDVDQIIRTREIGQEVNSIIDRFLLTKANLKHFEANLQKEIMNGYTTVALTTVLSTIQKILAT